MFTFQINVETKTEPAFKFYIGLNFVMQPSNQTNSVYTNAGGKVHDN